MRTLIEQAAIDTQMDIDRAGEFENVLDDWYSRDWCEEMLLEMRAKNLVIEEKAIGYVMDISREKGEMLSEKEFVERYKERICLPKNKSKSG